jgi:hypothetical protein
MFKDYYIGRRALYHNKNVTIISTNYDIIEYQDFGFQFEKFEIVLYYEDGTKKTASLKGNSIKKYLTLYSKNEKK